VLQPIVPGRIIGRALRVLPTDAVMGAAEPAKCKLRSAARAAALQHFNLLVSLVLGIQRSHGALPWSGVAKVIAAQHCLYSHRS